MTCKYELVCNDRKYCINHCSLCTYHHVRCIDFPCGDLKQMCSKEYCIHPHWRGTNE